MLLGDSSLITEGRFPFAKKYIKIFYGDSTDVEFIKFKVPIKSYERGNMPNFQKPEKSTQKR